jgi:hypothetical protein
MHFLHDVLMARHCEKQTTKVILSKSFYWPEMKENIVRTCVK